MEGSNLLGPVVKDKDLGKHIEELKDPLPLIHSLDMMLQIEKAMRYLHSKKVIHRDLKPENVLLKFRDDDSPLIKITDFGFSKSNFDTAIANTVGGTLKYMAPELIEEIRQGEGHYSKKVDVYSFGVICCEMLTAKVLQETASKVPRTVPDQLTILLESCVKQNPDDRPEFKDICDKLWLVKKQALTATSAQQQHYLLFRHPRSGSPQLPFSLDHALAPNAYP